MRHPLLEPIAEPRLVRRYETIDDTMGTKRTNVSERRRRDGPVGDRTIEQGLR